jgi:hypothetical protein
MATAKLCAADGCGKPATTRGYCNAHYCRLRYRGALPDKIAKRGSVAKWLDDVAVPYDGDACLAFPFAKDASGYGTMGIGVGSGNGITRAHVYVAERVIGPRPSPECIACHTCNNGHKACVTPRHLYWGTKKQNTADAIAAGTHYYFTPKRGEAHPRARMTEAQVLSIRGRVANGEKPKALADEYGVSVFVICKIKDRRNWRHI